MALVYIFLGPPGSGKDTQANLLAQSLGGIPVISTGEMIRQEATQGSPLALRALDYTRRGELVPDTLLFEMLEGFLSSINLQSGLIFTGFPRTLEQAVRLEDWLPQKGLDLKLVFHLDTPEETSLKRIMHRVEVDGAQGQKAREDDLEEQVIMERLRVYKESVQPILSYYAEKNKLKRIGNEGSIEVVFESIKGVVATL